MRWWFRKKLHTQIFICVAFGLLIGFILGPRATVIKPVGDIFIRLLKMLIVPLTFFTLANGITKMGDLRSFRSVGGMTLIFYLITSLVAVTIGIFSALILNPGKEAIGLLDMGEKVASPSFNFIDNIITWFPTNPIEAMAKTNMLQVIIFSIFVGIALLALGKKTKNITRTFGEAAELMIKITDFVTQFAPYGILALIANMVGTMESRILTEVGRFILTDYIALFIILIIGYPILLKFIGKRNVFRFYRNILPAMLVAASTTSSAATLPVSLSVAKKNLGVSEKIYGFILPLGATINMDGMAVAIGVISVFAANLYGVTITTGFIFQFMFLGLALSIGAAGVKGAGIVMSTVMLQTLNMPLSLVPILAAIWPIIDIGHTTTNITGDLNITTIVSSRFDMIDDITYMTKN